MANNTMKNDPKKIGVIMVKKIEGNYQRLIRV
jgi:hypothetical protein